MTPSLRTDLHYNPESGHLTWSAPRSRVSVGDRAGNLATGGYRQIKYNGVIYLEHRLIWLYVTGVFPVDQIDHINHVRDDNRWDNLREATQHENGKNQKLRVDNKAGIAGIFWAKRQRSWRVCINISQTKRQIGYFKDFLDACCARKSAENLHGYHCNHGK